MLPKYSRLKKNKDFKNVFETGKIIKGDTFVIQFAENGIKKSRFGFMVGIRLSKKAVVRNRLRRLFGEAVRKLSGQIKPGYDIVIIPKNAAEIVPAALISNLTNAFVKAGIIKYD